MEATQHPQKTQGFSSHNTQSSTNKLSSLFNKQAANFENARFGWMAIAITLQSCLGSVACMFIQENNASVFMLITCAAVTMGSNAMFISLSPPKWCLSAFYLSLVVNTFFILINI